MVDEHEDLQELLTRLNNIRDSMEEALGYVRGIVRKTTGVGCSKPTSGALYAKLPSK
jgi:hypothetical protein